MKKLLTAIAFSFAAMGMFAQSPLWMRDVQLSPDGKEIVFCYKGDLYKVPANGGAAIRLTSQDSYECSPVWSPDSKQIAFASDRNGNFDVFIMSAEGGAAQRLTTHSAGEQPTTFTPDGKYVLFTAAIQDPASSAMFPTAAMNELYKVPAKGGRTEQVLATPAEAVCYASDGKTFYYQDRKGFENEWRKHHTSSVTRDIWMYQAESGKHTQLTDWKGEDRNPRLSPDGKTLYFLSERKGSMNVYAFPTADSKNVKAVTSFKTHPLRFLSVDKNETLCFTYDGEIYTMPKGKSPRKVNIRLLCDDEEQQAMMGVNRGSSDASVSPDGKQIAFVLRGEIFVTSTEYGTTKQITHTAATEKSVTFGSDNRTLAYASERNGLWQLYTAKISRKEDLNFPNATLIEEEALLPSSTVERSNPQYSPDGKELAFVEDRSRLMVVNLKTKKVRQVTDGSTQFDTNGNFTYRWSPDGKWFTLEFVGNRHDPYYDIGLVSAEGGKPITNLTNSGYMSNNPRFVMDGKAILFETERYGMRNHASWGSMGDLMLVFLNQDAYDKYRMSKEDYELQKELEAEQKKEAEKAKQNEKKKDDKKKDDKKKEEDKKATDNKKDSKDIVVELNNIEDRIVRLTPNSSSLGDAIITQDGNTLFYLSRFESGYDLWKLDVKKRAPQLAQKGIGNGAFETDAKGNIYLLGGSLKKINSMSGAGTPVNVQGSLKMNLSDERETMFNHVCLQIEKRFYEKNLHGVDWNAMTKAYRKFLPHINNNYDFSKMLSELLGELNVSHTGSSYRANLQGETTADLGVFFDWDYTGKGLRIAEVIEKGPFDNKHSKVAAGTIIEKIDGTEITPDTDYNTLLNGKAGRKVLVSLYNPANKERWDEVVKPYNAGSLETLLYRRWVKQRAEDVDKWSNGRLGYVHLASMDDGSFRTIYSDILGKYNNREGIVIDTRFNGGGRLHEDIEILFSGKKYFTQVVRGREACDMPSRRWNKPSIMLTCEANYSNAHGTPWVYQHMKLGKVVGIPVPGTMTSVNWENLQDPSLVFGIPIIGYRLPDGSYLENQQLEPDIRVANSPESIVKGEDTQLKTAVQELLKELDAKK